VTDRASNTSNPVARRTIAARILAAKDVRAAKRKDLKRLGSKPPTKCNTATGSLKTAQDMACLLGEGDKPSPNRAAHKKAEPSEEEIGDMLRNSTRAGDQEDE